MKTFEDVDAQGSFAIHPLSPVPSHKNKLKINYDVGIEKHINVDT